MTTLNNNNEYPAYLDDIPEPDVAYYESISGGFDDCIYNEPVIIHTPTPPAKNNHLYRLDSFDILSRASAEISAQAATCGINWQVLGGLINRNQESYKTNSIALDKNYKGKVKAWLDIKLLNNGQEYPILTFHCLKNGGITEVFNGYQWLKDNGLIQAKPLNDAEKNALATKLAERDQQQAKRAELLAKKQAFENIQKTTRFNQFTTIFNALPKLSAAEFNHTYLAAKGFTFEQLPAEFVLKRGFDNRGGFIVYALKNARQQTTGYQKIYDKPFIDHSGNERNKDFIFLPSAKNGSYATLSNAKKINKALKIYLCEGLATALTVFIATGQPVAICLDAGNLIHVATALNVHFKNITLAADNDVKIDTVLNTGIDKAKAAAAAVNGSIVYPEMNGVKCDFDDLRSAKGLNAVTEQINSQLLAHQKNTFPNIDDLFNQQPKSKPHYPSKKYLTPEQASAQIQRLSDDFFKNLSANVAIKASAGSGKTHAVIDSLSKIAVAGQVHVFVPTHDLANEWQENLQQSAPDLKVLHLHGRGSSDSTDHFCNPERYAKVKQVQDKKLPVFATMCKQGDIECPFFKQCRYIKQFNQDNDIVILPHSYLSLNHATLEKKPAAVVIDERFFTELISSHSYPIKDIQDFKAWGDFRYDLLKTIDRVKSDKIGLFKALREVSGKPTAEILMDLDGIITHLNSLSNSRETAGITPNLSESEFNNKIKNIYPLNRQLNPLNALFKELSQFPEREESSLFKINGDHFILNNKHSDNRLNYYLENNIPILMIDADANETILNKLLTSKTENSLKESLPFLFNEIAVKRNAKIIQYINSQFAKSRFFPKGEDNAPDIKRIATAAQTVIKLSENKKTLLVTYKALETALLDANEFVLNSGYKFNLPDNINILHFGAIRGVDAFKDYEQVIILGRNQPPAAAMENLAAALFWDAPEQILFTGAYQKQLREYRTADGKIHSKEIHVHADARVQALVEQFRESEELQGVDRLRFIHNADASREIHILADTVLDIDVDVIADSTKLIPKGRTALAEIMDLNGGILPTSPKFLFNHYPDKFNNIQQVKDDLKRGKSVYSNLYIRLFPSLTYRLSSQKGGKDLIAFFEDSVNLSDVISKLASLHGEQIHVTGLCEPMRCEEQVTVSEQIIFTLELLENVEFPPLEESEPERNLEPIAYGITGIYSGYASNTLLRPVFNARLCPVT